jgi:hypothetical protein
MRALLLSAALLSVLSVTGCAGRPTKPATVMQLNPKGCNAEWNLASAQPIVMDSPEGEQAFRVDGDVRCMALSGGRSVSYAVYRLPRYRAPWTLQMESRISEGALFAPEALLLDGDGVVLRDIPFDRFAMRGERLETTIFFNQDNASEQFLLVHSAGAVVGRDERHVVSGSFVVPLLAGALPFLYMQGTESEGSFRYAHNGVVYLLARSQTYSPLRRNEQARAARAEMGLVSR